MLFSPFVLILIWLTTSRRLVLIHPPAAGELIGETLRGWWKGKYFEFLTQHSGLKLLPCTDHIFKYRFDTFQLFFFILYCKLKWEYAAAVFLMIVKLQYLSQIQILTQSTFNFSRQALEWKTNIAAPFLPIKGKTVLSVHCVAYGYIYKYI